MENMKKTALFVTVLLIIALVAYTTPVAAVRDAPIGERIRVRNASIEFPAGAPFYFQHGWIQPSTDDAIGVFSFALDVDGMPKQVTFKMFYAESGDPDLLTRLWVYNFPEGMAAGTHTFTGHWYAPCQYAVNSLGYPGSCNTPNDKVETTTRTLTVTFVP